MLDRTGRLKYYFIALVAVNVLLAYFFNRDLESKQHVYLSQNVSALQSQYKATMNAYDLLSRFVFDRLGNDTKLMTLLYDAANRDGKPQYKVRRQIRKHLEPLFRQLKRYHFTKFSLTFPDGSVCVQMQNKNAYDNAPSMAKPDLALQKITPQMRFSGSKSTFTYSEPLYARGTLVCHAHLSIAFDVFKSELTRLFPSYYQVVYTKENVLSSFAGSERKWFVQSNLSKEYYTDMSGHASDSLQKLLDDINAAIKDEAAFRMDRGEPFSLARSVQGQWFTVSFLPLADSAAGTSRAGYLISYTPDSIIESFNVAFWFRILLGNLLFGIVLGFIFYLDRHARQLKTMATHDTLTGIHNRREFDRITEQEFERSRRYKRPMSIILIDIDHFKMINDTFGHQEGDAVLKGLSDFIAENIRRPDFFARWGGEEFAILTTETTATEAAHLAENLRVKLMKQRFGKGEYITASFGVAQNDATVHDLEGLVQNADRALYRAKESGRNRVEIYR